MLISQYMESLGNDFMIIDGITQNFEVSDSNISKLSNVNNDLGYDQLMIILPPKDDVSDISVKIFNIDGSESENCVNGMRCVAQYVFDNKLINANELIISINDDLIIVSKIENSLLKVEMSNLSFEKEDIGLNNDAPNFLEYEGSKLIFHSLSVGNPHAVIFSEERDLNIPDIGKKIQDSGYFKNGINVGFMEVLSETEINLRVVERGVGETQACGSGACAAAIIGIKEGRLTNQVKVNFQKGSLEVSVDLIKNKVFLIGDANYRAKDIAVEL